MNDKEPNVFQMMLIIFGAALLGVGVATVIGFAIRAFRWASGL